MTDEELNELLDMIRKESARIDVRRRKKLALDLMCVDMDRDKRLLKEEIRCRATRPRRKRSKR